MKAKPGLGIVACVVLGAIAGCDEGARNGAEGPRAEAPPGGMERGSRDRPAGQVTSDAGQGLAAAGADAKTGWRLEWDVLQTEPQSGALENPRERDVAEVVARLASEREGQGFVILTNPGGRFMQAAGDASGFTVDYFDPAQEWGARRGTAEAADGLDAPGVLEAFRAFLGGADDFAQRPGWVKIDKDGNPLK